jgi:hypothetical protein
MYVKEHLNKNFLVLIFLQGLSFIIWLINSKLQGSALDKKKKKKKKRHHILTEEKLVDIGVFAKKITGKIGPAS